MPNMSVSVINLDRRADRMADISETLEAMNVDYTRISAVDASDPDVSWLTEGEPSEITGIPMTRGEHAVHASHNLVWRDALDRQLDAVVVLEDDVVISPDFSLLFRDGWLPSDADLVKIEAHWGEIEVGPATAGPFPDRRIRRLFSRNLGAAGYLVTAKGLRKLTSQITAETIRDPLDWTLFDRRSSVFNDLVIYQVEPALVVQHKYHGPAKEEEGESDLHADRRDEESKGGGKLAINSGQLKRLSLRGLSRLRSRKRLTVRYRA